MLVQIFWKVNKSWQQTRYSRNHIMYILLKQYKLAHWVGCRKSQWNKMTTYMQCPYWKRESGNP